MQQDGPVHQVQAEEHQHRQQQLDVQQGLAVAGGHTERSRGGGVRIQAGSPVCANRMDGADQQLHSDHEDPVAGHGNTPVHMVVVHNKQLESGGGQEDVKMVLQ